MTLNILELEKKYDDEDVINLVGENDYNSEEKRMKFLQELQSSLKRNGGKLDYDDPINFVDILSSSFSDSYPSTRTLSMDVLSTAIPLYGYDLDNHMGLLFPQLLQNLLHSNASVKKSALQAIHTYFKYSSNKSIAINLLVKHGINNFEKAVRNEVLLAIPALIRSGFTELQFEEIFTSVLKTVPKVENGDSTLPVVLCLEHIKSVMGEHQFKDYFVSLDIELGTKYVKMMENSSFVRTSTNNDLNSSLYKHVENPEDVENIVNVNKDKDNNMLFGFIPSGIVSTLANKNISHERLDAINELMDIINLNVDDNLLKENCNDLLVLLSELVDDANVNVSLTALNIVHKVVIKINIHVRTYLPLVMKVLLKKLNDPKLVVRKINLRISLSLMHSLSPTVYIQSIIPYLKHKNTHTREEIINMITAALLSFPSSDFDLISLPGQLSFTLLDTKKRVRHASLECFAMLAQLLGAGRLSPLVSAVNSLEDQDGGNGVLAAVQARLRRGKLPRIDADGLIEYAFSVPANSSRGSHVDLDIAWVKAGSFIGGETSRQDMSDSSQRRHFSAGKKKLPWQNGDEFRVEPQPRKTVGSAPVRPVGDFQNNETSAMLDTWIPSHPGSHNDSHHFNKFMSHSKTALHQNPYENQPSESQGSYFEMYKHKMKKFKAAGLQADSNIINSINPNMAFRNMLPTNVRDGRQFNMAYDKAGKNSNVKNDVLVLEDVQSSPLVSPTDDHCVTPTKMLSPREKESHGTPVPFKPTLARSASKKRQKLRMDAKREWDVEKEYNDEQMLAHTLPKTKHDQFAKRRISLESCSPFPSRPTIHRTPSGRLTTRQVSSGHHGVPELSNLQKMKKFSNSSPAISSGLITAMPSPEVLSPVSPVGRNNTHSPCIRIPQAKVLSPVNPANSPRHKPYVEYPLKTRGESTHAGPDSVDENEHPGSPKLAKSAQEKLRKLKEDRLRQSTDTALVVKRKKDHRMSRSLDTVEGLKKLSSYTEDDYDWLAYTERQKQESKHVKSKEEGLKEEQLRLTNEKQKRVEEDMIQYHKKQTIINYDDIAVGGSKKNRRHKAVDANKSIEIPLNRRPQKHIDSFEDSEVETTQEHVVKRWLPDHEDKQSNELNGDLQISGAAMFENHNHIRTHHEIVEKHDKQKVRTLDFNNNDDINSEDLMIKGEKQRKAPRPPKVASSPQTQRKHVRSASPRNKMEEESPPPRTHSYSEDLEQRLSNPQQSVPNALRLLASGPEDWECKCDGLVTIRRLTKFHPEYLSDEFHMIVEAVLEQVKNLRSQVTRLALNAIADFFAYVPRLVEPELDVILKSVLPKAGDTNQFIKADVELALQNLVENVHPPKAAAAIITVGLGHRNALIRKSGAKALADMAESLGSARLLSAHKDIIPVAGKLAVDAQPDARYHARRILMLFLNHPDLDNILQKRLTSVNLRPVRDIIENLKNKGLGDPPTGSTTLRKSMRTSTMPSPVTNRRSCNTTPVRSVLKDAENMDGFTNHLDSDVRFSGRQKRRSPGRENTKGASQFDFSKLEKLDSASWSERYEGLDDFFDLVSMNPSGVSTHAIKIFDKLCPRLNDSNSKVNLYALHTLGRCIPILRNGISSAMTLIVDNLKTPLSSKNEPIYQAAKECLLLLIKFIDNSFLVQPLVTCVQYGNARNKPELAERLADIIRPVYSRKPGLITRIVLPLLWNLLSTSPSGATTPGRANMQNVIGRICNILYSCLGVELVEEAQTKGARVSQRLEAFLQQ